MRSGKTYRLLLAVLLITPGSALQAQTGTPRFEVGRAPTPEEIAAWNLMASPDGSDLPPGKGTAKEGADIFAKRCAACHGAKGDGGSAPTLVGRLDSLQPPLLKVKITTAAWPFATSIWSAIHSSMPPRAPKPVSVDEAYSLTATLLYWSGIIKETDVMTEQTLPKVTMPRHGNFSPPLPDLVRSRCRQGTCR